MSVSNLPTIQRFKYEDYPGLPKEFAQFLSALNLFVNPVYNILNGGVDYQNLVVPRIYTTTITSPASGNTTLSFKNPLSIIPSSVVVGNIYSVIPSTHPSSPVQAFWHFSQGTIYIDNLTNLSASTSYTVSLVVH